MFFMLNLHCHVIVGDQDGSRTSVTRQIINSNVHEQNVVWSSLFLSPEPLSFRDL